MRWRKTVGRSTMTRSKLLYHDRGPINRGIVDEPRAHADVLRVRPARFCRERTADRTMVQRHRPIPFPHGPGALLGCALLKQLPGNTNRGRIRTVASEDEPFPTGLPVVRISPHGACSLLSPNQPVTHVRLPNPALLEFSVCTLRARRLEAGLVYSRAGRVRSPSKARTLGGLRCCLTDENAKCIRRSVTRFGSAAR